MVPWIDGARLARLTVPCPGGGISQVLFCMGNAEISMQLAGRYYCGGGGGGGAPRSDRGGRGSKPLNKHGNRVTMSPSNYKTGIALEF